MTKLTEGVLLGIVKEVVQTYHKNHLSRRETVMKDIKMKIQIQLESLGKEDLKNYRSDIENQRLNKDAFLWDTTQNISDKLIPVVNEYLTSQTVNDKSELCADNSVGIKHDKGDLPVHASSSQRRQDQHRMVGKKDEGPEKEQVKSAKDYHEIRNYDNKEERKLAKNAGDDSVKKNQSDLDLLSLSLGKNSDDPVDSGSDVASDIMSGSTEDSSNDGDSLNDGFDHDDHTFVRSIQDQQKGAKANANAFGKYMASNSMGERLSNADETIKPMESVSCVLSKRQKSGKRNIQSSSRLPDSKEANKEHKLRSQVPSAETSTLLSNYQTDYTNDCDSLRVVSGDSLNSDRNQDGNLQRPERALKMPQIKNKKPNSSQYPTNRRARAQAELKAEPTRNYQLGSSRQRRSSLPEISGTQGQQVHNRSANHRPNLQVNQYVFNGLSALRTRVPSSGFAPKPPQVPNGQHRSSSKIVNTKNVRRHSYREVSRTRYKSKTKSDRQIAQGNNSPNIESLDIVAPSAKEGIGKKPDIITKRSSTGICQSPDGDEIAIATGECIAVCDSNGDSVKSHRLDCQRIFDIAFLDKDTYAVTMTLTSKSRKVVGVWKDGKVRQLLELPGDAEPKGLARDDCFLYVVDSKNCCLHKFGLGELRYVGQLHLCGENPSGKPYMVNVSTDKICVTDFFNRCLYVINKGDPNSTAVKIMIQSLTKSRDIYSPTGVYCHEGGNTVIALASSDDGEKGKLIVVNKDMEPYHGLQETEAKHPEGVIIRNDGKNIVCDAVGPKSLSYQLEAYSA